VSARLAFCSVIRAHPQVFGVTRFALLDTVNSDGGLKSTFLGPNIQEFIMALNSRLLTLVSVGLLAGACAGPYDRQASLPVYPERAQTMSERACLDYGFTAGSGAYGRCVQREANARAAGRVSRDYAEARLVEDARNACYDYGLERGMQRYDNCVTHEVDARRYREQGQTYGPTPYYEPQNQPRATTTGVAVSRDEFGFRYDVQGNRVDRFGHIVSPQSTQP
jgi:hypothetical protein